MASTIQQRAAALAQKTTIKARDAGGLVTLAEKDEKVTKTEANALSKVARLGNDRFEKIQGKVASAVEDLRLTAELTQKLLNTPLDVKSSVPGLTVAFDKHVSVDAGEYGTSYHRFLNVQMKGKTAAADGTLAFEYGDFKVTVPVKKGQKAETIFNAVERKVLAQQNGAMSIRGGFDNDRVLNPSIGLGIHRTAPMTKVEKLQFERNMLWADLMIMNSEGAPNSLTRPLAKEIEKLDAQIKKLQDG